LFVEVSKSPATLEKILQNSSRKISRRGDQSAEKYSQVKDFQRNPGNLQ
jgi:hypothetical protein